MERETAGRVQRFQLAVARMANANPLSGAACR